MLLLMLPAAAAAALSRARGAKKNNDFRGRVALPRIALNGQITLWPPARAVTRDYTGL